ncbi:MAG TPA: hypothetical protein VG722_10090 [Tepidisphaeraceae bacterium]|nr:hypothetical protein [Tepidisphaeraceae bacterium]
MGDRVLVDFHADVRHRLRHFLWDERERKSARAGALRRIMEHGWKSCLFGGVVRDIIVKSPWVETRDIDIVVADVSTNDLEHAFADVMLRKTRFGGLTLNIGGWLFDVWPLSATWGCKFFPLFAESFSVLPKTTFFSVEAIAVELPVKHGVPRTIYQDKFLKSIETRTIMLNLAENPYPELCVVRAFALARKLDFSLDVQLVRHLAGWAKRLPLSGIEKAMLSHYGKASFSSSELRLLIKRLRAHAESGDEFALRIPTVRQMLLPFNRPEPLDHFLADCLDGAKRG